MTTPCPTCGRRITKRKAKADAEPAMLLINKSDRPTAFHAWLNHFYATRQTYTAHYWERRGYMRVPTLFPPAYHK